MNTKTVIVTGASSGIGFAIAQAFIDRGYNVIGNGTTLDNLASAAEKMDNPSNFHFLAGDISQPQTAQALFDYAEKHFGKVDILINNAGIFIPKPVVDYTELDIDRMIDINLKGFIYTSQSAVAHMAQHNSGHIINITAALAIQPNAKLPALLCGLTKGGLNSAVKALAIEVAPMNIMVNAVAPGVIETPMNAGNEDLKTFLKSLAPVNEMGQTQDIVNAVLYLCDAKFVTGTILPVDGGSTAGTW